MGPHFDNEINVFVIAETKSFSWGRERSKTGVEAASNSMTWKNSSPKGWNCKENIRNIIENRTEQRGTEQNGREEENRWEEKRREQNRTEQKGRGQKGIKEENRRRKYKGTEKKRIQQKRKRIKMKNEIVSENKNWMIFKITFEPAPVNLSNNFYFNFCSSYLLYHHNFEAL